MAFVEGKIVRNLSIKGPQGDLPYPGSRRKLSKIANPFSLVVLICDHHILADLTMEILSPTKTSLLVGSFVLKLSPPKKMCHPKKGLALLSAQRSPDHSPARRRRSVCLSCEVVTDHKDREVYQPQLFIAKPYCNQLVSKTGVLGGWGQKL